MNPMNFLLRTCVGATALGTVLPALAQSPWLPVEGRLEITPRYVYQNFQEFWIRRDQRMKLDEDVVQHTGTLSAEYGITQDWAVDATLGYTRVDSKAFGGSNTDDGLADTRLGVRYRIVDERDTSQNWVPTVTLRVGGIVAGTYDAGLPFSAGDGAHGGEFSMLVGKAIGGTGFGIYGEAGYRLRENPVPDEFFGLLGVYQTLGQFTLSAGYRHIQSLSGVNIMDEGFTFPELKEINQLFEAGLGFTDKGGRFYQIFGAFTLDGRNTGDKMILGISATFGF